MHKVPVFMRSTGILINTSMGHTEPAHRAPKSLVSPLVVYSVANSRERMCLAFWKYCLLLGVRFSDLLLVRPV
jgi:hypothetical protein